MNLLSNAAGCLAIDVVNNILVYTEHWDPVMTVMTWEGIHQKQEESDRKKQEGTSRK